jgi:hypothetical protein
MLRGKTHKILFRQYQSLADIAAALPDFHFTPAGTLITLDGDPGAS